MELPKYCEKRKSKKEGVYYAHNPSAQMKSISKISYKKFDNIKELRSYADDCVKRLRDSLRKDRNEVNVDPHSVRGLVHHYLSSSYFIKLKPNSKASYQELFKFGLDFVPRGSNKTFGEYNYRSVDRAYVDRLNVSIEQNASVHRVFHFNKVMRRVYNVGIKHEKINHNPFTMQEITPPKSRTLLWTEELLNRFISTADEMGYSSIGTIALFCYSLSQRPGDIRQLTSNNLKNGILSFVQEKSITCRGGDPVSLRFNLNEEPLTILLDRLQTKHLSGLCSQSWSETPLIIYETTGRALTRTNVIKCTQRVREKAGLPKELQMRDYRATGATNLGLAGCSTNELMSVTGHKDPKTVQIYLRNAEGMRANALAKLASKSSANHNTS